MITKYLDNIYCQFCLCWKWRLGVLWGIWVTPSCCLMAALWTIPWSRGEIRMKTRENLKEGKTILWHFRDMLFVTWYLQILPALPGDSWRWHPVQHWQVPSDIITITLILEILTKLFYNNHNTVKAGGEYTWFSVWSCHMPKIASICMQQNF